MPNTADQIPLLRLLLASSGRHDTLKGLLDEVLPEARELLPAASLVVVHSNPPKWEVQSASGLSHRLKQRLHRVRLPPSVGDFENRLQPANAMLASLPAKH